MRSIHPSNFISIASIGFVICSRQKSRIKKRAITQNLGKQKLRSNNPQNFITIACLVLEICTGKNPSIKKKQRAITQQEGQDGPGSLT